MIYSSMLIKLRKDNSITVKLHSLFALIKNHQNEMYTVGDDKDHLYLWHDLFSKSKKTIKAMGLELIEDSTIATSSRKYENVFPTFAKVDSFVSKRSIVRVDEGFVSNISQYLFESDYDKFHVTKSGNHFYFLIEGAPIFWSHKLLFFKNFDVFTERKQNIFVASNEEFIFQDLLLKDGNNGYFVIENGNQIFLGADKFKYSYDIVNFNFNLDKIRSETNEFDKIDVRLELKMMSNIANNNKITLWHLTETDIERLPDLIDILSEEEREAVTIGGYEINGELNYFCKVSPRFTSKEGYTQILNFFTGEKYYSAYDNIRVYVKEGYRIFPDVDSRAIYELVKGVENYISVFTGNDTSHKLLSFKENTFVQLAKSYTITSLRFPERLDGIFSSIHFEHDGFSEKRRSGESVSITEKNTDRKERQEKEIMHNTKTAINPNFEVVSAGGIRGKIWSNIYAEFKHPSVYGRAVLYTKDNVTKHDESCAKYNTFLESDAIYDDKKVKAIIADIQKNIRSISKHYYWFFMKELASKLSDSLLLQQQKEFMFSYLNSNGLGEIDFPPFVISSKKEDEIEKDTFVETMKMIVKHPSIPNDDVRYVINEFAKLALSFNSETLDIKINANVNDPLQRIALEKIKDRHDLVTSGKVQESDWIDFLSNAKLNKRGSYSDNQSNMISNFRYIRDVQLEKDDFGMKALKELISGGSPDKIIKAFAAKKPSKDMLTVFFSGVVENIRSINTTELSSAINTYFPYTTDSRTGYGLVIVYLCLYGMSGDIKGMTSLKDDLIAILSSNTEITYYNSLATVASICGYDFTTDVIKTIDKNSNALPTVSILLECSKMALLYGAGRSDDLYIAGMAFVESIKKNFEMKTIHSPFYNKNVFFNFFNYCSSLTLTQRHTLISECIKLSSMPGITSLDKSSPNTRIGCLSIITSIIYAVMNSGTLKDRTMRAFLSREESTLRQEIIGTKI